MIKLSFQIPNGSIRAVDLTNLTQALVIGRDRDMAQLVIPDPQLSRAHCVIRPENEGFLIEDLGSRNGTWVNRERINKSRLRVGDQILIGSTNIRVGAKAGSGSLSNPLLGERIGGFELQEVMGQGSYGTVYRGMQVNLQRPVAIKFLDERHMQDSERVKEFLTEARRAGRLNHPNVVQVHDVCQVDKYLFLVMELLTGGSVGDLLRLEGALDNHQCCQVLIDVGNALAYAESQGLVHRDVKPDNILLNEEGIHKLADLGIAAPISADGLARQERAFGSAHYVAPEQALGGTIDGRADIYALGASLYHLMTCHTMYQGTSRQIVTQHVKSPMPNLRQLTNDHHPDLIDLVSSMLSKTPEKRPSSGLIIASTAAAILEKLDAGPTESNPGARRRSAMRRRRRRSTRRRR